MLERECKKTGRLTEQSQKKDAQIRQARIEMRWLEADLGARKAKAGKAGRRAARLDAAAKRQKGKIAELKQRSQA